MLPNSGMTHFCFKNSRFMDNCRCIALKFCCVPSKLFEINPISYNGKKKLLPQKTASLFRFNPPKSIFSFGRVSIMQIPI